MTAKGPARPTLTVSLGEVTVVCNGRPPQAPRPMDVALLVQLRDPAAASTAEPLATESLTFRAGAGETVSASALPPGKDGRPFFGKAVEVPRAVVIDLRFLVLYQNDLGPVVGAVVNELVDLALAKVPLLPDEVKKRLHLKLGESLAEEYGRQKILVRVPESGAETHAVVAELLAPETVRGVYMLPATGTSAPRPSRPTTFIDAGGVAATVTLEVKVSGGPVTGKARSTSRKRRAAVPTRPATPARRGSTAAPSRRGAGRKG